MPRYLLALFLALAATVQAGTVTPTWNFTDFVPNSYGINTVLIQPIATIGSDGSSTIYVGEPIRTYTTAGSLTTNLLNGYAYRVTFYGRLSPYSITNSFGTNVTGSVNAAAYLATTTNLAANVYAYSQAASDARYAPIGSSFNTNVLGSAAYVSTNRFDTNGAATAVQAGVVSGSIVAAQATHATNADSATTASTASVATFAATASSVAATGVAPGNLGASVLVTSPLNGALLTGTITNNTTGNASSASSIANNTISNNSPTILTIAANSNSYAEVNIQNFSNGGSASSDLTATANNGSANQFYVNVGINSSGFTNQTALPSGTNTAYVIAQGNAGNTNGGTTVNLVIGTAQTNSAISFSTGNGLTQTNLQLNSSGLALSIGQFSGNGAGLTNSTTALPANTNSVVSAAQAATIARASSTSGGVTNGLTDPLAISFVASNNITDPYIQGLAQKHVQRLRTLAAFTNLQREFIFNSAYNPTNNLDLFGNTGTTVNPSYDVFGFSQNMTNYFTANLGSGYTNWTIIIFRKPNIDACEASPATSSSLFLEWSLEGAHNSGYFNYAGNHQGRNFQSDNVTTLLPSGSNVNNTTWLSVPSMNGSQSYRWESFPTITAYSSDGNGTLIGYQDGLQMFSRNTTSKTNLNDTINGNLTTNYQAVTALYIGGGSTNWFNSYVMTAGAPPSRFCTNWMGSTFSVAIFNSILSPSDVYAYGKAVYELWPYKKSATAWFGTSMFAEYQNRVSLTGGYSPLTNCPPSYVALRHPYEISKNYAKGGASIETLKNVVYAGGGTGWFPTNVLTQFPSDWDVTLITDFPRNNFLNTNAQNATWAAFTSSLQIQSNNVICSNLANAFAPYAAVVNRTWAWESVLSSTNAQTVLPNFGIPAYRFAAYQTTLAVETNLATMQLFSKYLHIQAFVYGSIWDTNNGYFAGDANGGAHIEGTNGPILFQQQAAYFDTGEWPNQATNLKWIPYVYTNGY